MTQAHATQKKHHEKFTFLKLLTFSSTLRLLKERDPLVCNLHFIHFWMKYKNYSLNLNYFIQSNIKMM